MGLFDQHQCVRCHGVAEYGFGDQWVCEDCYGIIGSCCMEFDGDDLFMESRSWTETRVDTKVSQ